MVDWLAGRRTGVAAERILDAAGRLFAEHGPDRVGMREIAHAAGCSRATLYRYFDSRDALFTAWVHREARRVYAGLTDRLAGVDDPRRRLTEGILGALRAVRENPALAAWFDHRSTIGGEVAERSAVITAMVRAFMAGLGADSAERRARWLVRVITSLLLFPERDERAERALLDEFVVPVLVPVRPPSTPAP